VTLSAPRAVSAARRGLQSLFTTPHRGSPGPFLFQPARRSPGLRSCPFGLARSRCYLSPRVASLRGLDLGHLRKHVAVLSERRRSPAQPTGTGIFKAHARR
ncbi:hypothetical protein NDU88_005155, partial [Pleurodeles waltl]